MSRDVPLMPWVVVSGNGVMWLGLAKDEDCAWTYALGWPSKEEIEDKKKKGWYAKDATVSWKED